jgi:hypothetical protein
MQKFLMCVLACVLLSAGVQPAVAQDFEAQVCAAIPDQCRLNVIGQSDGYFSKKPEIEYDICDIWPELCNNDEFFAAGFTKRSVDLCVLIPEKCGVVAEPETAQQSLQFVQQRALMNEGVDNPWACQFAPLSCEPQAAISNLITDSTRKNIEYDICDIWPELCADDASMGGTRTINICALVPEKCAVTNRQLLIDGFSSAFNQIQ